MTQLSSISFVDYKRFGRFTLTCQKANVLVGPNNSGKSSLLDAFRVLYGALRFARRLRPRQIETANGDDWGYVIPAGSVPISTANVIRNFGDTAAQIKFRHSNGRELIVELRPHEGASLYIPESAKYAGSGKSYFNRFPLDLVIVPTLSPMEQEEDIVSPETLERNRTGRLSSRNFRQIWYNASDEDFQEFSELVSSTWPGITLFKPTIELATRQLTMFYREDRVDKEISWSGFGLQVWLQILTRSLRGGADTVFVLDEPDIYLHSDLQIKLLNFIESRFAQYFLATHSAEIINSMPAGDIVLVSSKYKAGKRVKSDAEYNEVFSAIGSIENIDLARLSRSKRVIFYEGNDRAILDRLYREAWIDEGSG